MVEQYYNDEMSAAVATASTMDEIERTLDYLYASRVPVTPKQEVAPLVAADYYSDISEDDVKEDDQYGSACDNSDKKGNGDLDANANAHEPESDSSDGEVLLDPRLQNTSRLYKQSAPTTSPNKTVPSKTTPPPAPVQVLQPTPANNSNDIPVEDIEDEDEDGEDSDGEIRDPESVLKMTRIFYPTQMSFEEVERSRQSVIRLQRLPNEIASKGEYARFSKDEIESVMGVSRSRLRSRKQKEASKPAQHRPKPTFRAKLGRLGLSLINHSSDPRTCDKCGKTFTRPSGLQYHMEHVHIDSVEAARTEEAKRKYGCDTCGRRFTTRSHLTTHSQIHTGVSLFPCRVAGCERKFKGWTSRRVHEERCGGPPQPAVQLEDEDGSVSVVSTPAEGTYGIVINGDRILLKRPIGWAKQKPRTLAAVLDKQDPGRKKCLYCDQKFTSPSARRQHEVRHAGGKQFKCTYEGCTAEFTMSISLTEHVRMLHTGEKPYKCMYEGCGEAFARVLTFKHHIRSKHLQTKYPCPKCDQIFTMKSSLDRHEKIHMGLRPYLCTTCGKTFRTAFNLKLHSRVHLKSPPPRRVKKVKKPRDWSKRKPKQPKYDELGNVIEQERPYCCTFEGCGKAFVLEKNLLTHVKAQHGGHHNVDSDISSNISESMVTPMVGKKSRPVFQSPSTSIASTANDHSSPESEQYGLQYCHPELLALSDPRTRSSFYVRSTNQQPTFPDPGFGSTYWNGCGP